MVVFGGGNEDIVDELHVYKQVTRLNFGKITFSFNFLNREFF